MSSLARCPDILAVEPGSIHRSPRGEDETDLPTRHRANLVELPVTTTITHTTTKTAPVRIAVPRLDSRRSTSADRPRGGQMPRQDEGAVSHRFRPRNTSLVEDRGEWSEEE